MYFVIFYEYWNVLEDRRHLLLLGCMATHFEKHYNQAGYCKGRVLDLYFGSVWFESPSECPLHWQFPWFSSVPLSKCQYGFTNCVTPVTGYEFSWNRVKYRYVFGCKTEIKVLKQTVALKISTQIYEKHFFLGHLHWKWVQCMLRTQMVMKISNMIRNYQILFTSFIFKEMYLRNTV